MGRLTAFVVGLVFLIIGAIGLIGPWYQSYEFGNNCGDYLKRAADAPSLELADQAMDTALAYLRSNDIGPNSGYSTLILDKTEHDVGYWYVQLQAAHQDVKDTMESGEVDKLTESNALIKLREVLLDGGATGDTLTLPVNIAYYPNQWIWRLLGTFGWIIGFIGAIVILVALRLE